MPDDPKPEDKSDIAVLALPNGGFQSRIPAHLLKDKSEEEQYIFGEVSKMASFIEWSAPIIVATHEQSRRTNGRLKGLEAWKAMFTSWWGLFGAILSIIGGLAGLVAVLQFFIAK